MNYTCNNEPPFFFKNEPFATFGGEKMNRFTGKDKPLDLDFGALNTAVPFRDPLKKPQTKGNLVICSNQGKITWGEGNKQKHTHTH